MSDNLKSMEKDDNSNSKIAEFVILFEHSSLEIIELLVLVTFNGSGLKLDDQVLRMTTLINKSPISIVRQKLLKQFSNVHSNQGEYGLLKLILDKFNDFAESRNALIHSINITGSIEHLSKIIDVNPEDKVKLEKNSIMIKKKLRPDLSGQLIHKEKLIALLDNAGPILIYLRKFKDLYYEKTKSRDTSLMFSDIEIEKIKALNLTLTDHL